jgi:hypothetical protein
MYVQCNVGQGRRMYIFCIGKTPTPVSGDGMVFILTLLRIFLGHGRPLTSSVTAVNLFMLMSGLSHSSQHTPFSVQNIPPSSMAELGHKYKVVFASFVTEGYDCGRGCFYTPPPPHPPSVTLFPGCKLGPRSIPVPTIVE